MNFITLSLPQFEAMLQITGGEIGDVGGRLFEEIVLARLHAVTSITYFYYDNENTDIRSQKLDLAAIKEFETSNKRDVTEMESETAAVTHSPNAKHLDFHGKETHGIQVNLASRKRKCSN